MDAERSAGVASGDNAGRIKVLVSNPAAVHVETERADLIVLGARPAEVSESVSDATSFGDVVDRVRSLPGEYSIVCVDSDNGTVVRAYRSIASTFNVYFCRRPRDGTIVVGDHFRNVLSELPVSSRTVPPTVPPDQLLLGTRPTGSYVEEVGRLGHGERLELVPGEPPETDLLGTLSTGAELTADEAKRRLDRHFRDRVDDRHLDGPVATMLSGGVDSALLHTYREGDATVSAAVDSPEFEFEVGYARETSDLLESDHELLWHDEDRYLEHLEATVDATGHPLLLPQAPLIRSAMAETDYRTYVNGALADGLFGTTTAAVAYLARFAGPAGQFLPASGGPVAKLAETAEGLRRLATDPEGSAMNFRIHYEPDRIADLFGRDTVDERKRERLRYTRRRVPVDDGRGYGPHMHLGHWIEAFHDNITTIWQHAAHAHGKIMYTPFCSRAVFETVLAVPPADRYARFAVPPRDHPLLFVQHKYLLKDLLGERLPGYDTKQPKGHGRLPTERYLDEGPLSTVFDRYSVPEFVPDEYRDAVRNGTDNRTWYAANYAVWRDRILTNDDLEPFDSTTVIER